jgi:hypothetical protein
LTVSQDRRIFVNFPRWGDYVPYIVAEIRNGEVVAFPDAAINKFNPSRPGETLCTVQSVVVDPANRLWILDTAAPLFSTPVPGGAKLIAVDLATNKVEGINHFYSTPKRRTAQFCIGSQIVKQWMLFVFFGRHYESPRLLMKSRNEPKQAHPIARRTVQFQLESI